MASWAEHTIWWHVYPMGFTGAEKAAPVPGEPVRHRLRPDDPALVPGHSWAILSW